VLRALAAVRTTELWLLRYWSPSSAVISHTSGAPRPLPNPPTQGPAYLCLARVLLRAGRTYAWPVSCTLTAPPEWAA
jgi:hypothetical protein